jgi:hypothetical protein
MSACHYSSARALEAMNGSQWIVGNTQVAISRTSRNSAASSGDAILGCLFGVSRRTRPTPTVQKTRFTGEELQVKFLSDCAEIFLKC